MHFLSYKLKTIELDFDGEIETTCTIEKLGEILEKKKKDRLFKTSKNDRRNLSK